MISQSIQTRTIETFRIVAIYSLFGLAWIYGSDTVLGWLVHDPVEMVKIAVIKGSLFILCTATLLYFLINRFLRQVISAESGQLESLKKYETIFNATNEAIFVHDALSGHILDVNERMLEIYGYTRDEVLAVEIGVLSEGAPPYSQVEAADKVRKALLEGPQVFEWHSRKKNGELFWSEVSLRRITNHGYDRIIAVVRDISGRKQFEGALRMREARHQAILDSAMDGFWVVSNDGRILEVNDAYCQMSGYSKQELLTMSIADFDVNETTDDTVAHNDKIKTQGSDRFETQHRRKDGTVYDIEVSSTFMPIEGGILVGFLRDISDRKRAEESLQFERNRAQSYLDTVETIIIALDVEGRITVANRKACQVLGYREEEILGQFWFKICLPQPEGMKIVYPYFQGNIDGNLDGSEYFENQIVNNKSELRHIAWHNTVLRDDQGRIYSTLSAGEDITERKKVDEALRDAEWKFKALFENGPIGVAYHSMIYDESGKPVDYYFIDANENYLALTGVDPRGKTVTQAFPGIENDPFDWIGVFGHVAKTGETIHFEQYFVANDRWYDVIGYQYKPDHFVASFVEITDRKKAQAALEESTAKIVTLVNNVPGYVAFVNAATLKYEFVNVAFEKSFGIPLEKITGSFVKDIIGEDNFQFALKYIEEARAGKSASYENVFDLVSGKRWIQVNYNPIIDASGQVVSLVVHSFDITDLKEHENERLKIEKLESLGVLAGGIAHDFNNILTGIMGNISLAKKFIDGSHKSFNALEGAEKASVRATELARQLLTFAKGGEPVKKVVSIQSIVNESVSLVLHGSNVKGTIDIPDSLYPIEADEGQISARFSTTSSSTPRRQCPEEAL